MSRHVVCHDYRGIPSSYLLQAACLVLNTSEDLVNPQHKLPTTFKYGQLVHSSDTFGMVA